MNESAQGIFAVAGTEDNSSGQTSNQLTAENSNTPAPPAEPRTAEGDSSSAAPKPPSESREGHHHVPMLHESRRNEQHHQDEQYGSWQQQQQQQQTVAPASSPPPPSPLSVSAISSAANGEGNAGGGGTAGATGGGQPPQLQAPQPQPQPSTTREDQLAGNGADHDRQTSSTNERQMLQHQQGQMQQSQQPDPWSRDGAGGDRQLWQSKVQAQHELAKQQQQQQQQQQQHQQQQLIQQHQPSKIDQQAQVDADRWRIALLSGYVPPPAYIHVNVSTLMQQTSSAIERWGELQKTLDVTSDSATPNLAAQAQARASLKRDLTNLTQLADAQTKHIQRAKMRQLQVMQTNKQPAQGGFASAQGGFASAQGGFPGGSTARVMAGTATGAGAVAGAAVMAGDAYGFPPKPHDVNPSLAGVVPSATMRVPSMPLPSSHVSSTAPSIGAVLLQQQQQQLHQHQQQQGGGGGGPGVTHGVVSASARPLDHPEDGRMGHAPSDWASALPGATRPAGLSTSPSPPLPLPPPSVAVPLATSIPQVPRHQQAMPQQHRLREIKQRLDITEPRNKWVVLVEASLRLPSHESSTYKQFFMTIQGMLTSYNGAAGAEVAGALRSCMDPRVFDPQNIKRSQELMANVYAQWARRGQR